MELRRRQIGKHGRLALMVPITCTTSPVVLGGATGKMIDPIRVLLTRVPNEHHLRGQMTLFVHAVLVHSAQRVLRSDADSRPVGSDGGWSSPGPDVSGSSAASDVSGSSMISGTNVSNFPPSWLAAS